MLRKALAAVGRVDNHNLRLEFRLAEGDPERYPALAERLVQDGASVVIAYGTPPVRAAQQATTTIPIVAVAYDLVDAGFITSLAKPGGNITGVSILSPELGTKKLDILKQIVPAARRFGELTEDEYFCSEAGARDGVTFENTSETESLVCLRYFGPEVNPDAPKLGAYKAERSR